MKVAHILYRLMPSGAEMMLRIAAATYRKAGIEGYIIANDDDEGPYADDLKKAGYAIHRIPWRSSRGHLVDFWRFCRREKIDVVHIHVARGYLGFALAARLAGVKTIVKTFHAIFEPKSVARLAWQMAQRQIIARLGVRCHAISMSVQENEWKRYRIHTKLIWNWIDEAAFPLVDAERGLAVRKNLDIDQDAFVLLSVGNCHSASHMRIKNHALILKAIARLPEELQRKLVYVHVGNEADGYPERRLADALGIAGRVKFLGARNDVYDLLCAADLFVMSSLHEGLGNSVIEALVSGREPLLVTTPGLVDFGKVVSGIRYCRPEAADMAAALSRYLGGIQTTLEHFRLREGALASFSIARSVPEMIKVYQGT